MEAKGQAKPKVRRVTYTALHKLAVGVSLLSFCVILAAGLMAGARIITITYRACIVTLIVSLVSRVVVSILATYEEMNSGKA